MTRVTAKPEAFWSVDEVSIDSVLDWLGTPYRDPGEDLKAVICQMLLDVPSVRREDRMEMHRTKGLGLRRGFNCHFSTLVKEARVSTRKDSSLSESRPNNRIRRR